MFGVVNLLWMATGMLAWMAATDRLATSAWRVIGLTLVCPAALLLGPLAWVPVLFIVWSDES